MAIRNKRDENFIKSANEIIEANLSNERFGVTELAGRMNMSRSNLHRKIKSITGASISQYLRKIRMDKAFEFLKEEPITISEVAFRVGFGSPAYFSKSFREYFGFSPSEIHQVELKDLDPERGNVNGHREESKNKMINFPVQTTSFIGREKEMDAILGLIREHRIVSLVGTGGCGKTRLACEVVAQCVDSYRDGKWFVDLAMVESEDLVPKQLMSTLEIIEIPGREIMEVIIERIRDKELLILLDNCEHLLGACAEVTGRLAEAIPGLSLLVTSREALKIKGERVWIAPPLTLIDPASIVDVEHAMSAESVRMYSERALLYNPGFKLALENVADVATICTKVDGIPLAIELVSSRTRHMDSGTMLDRLSGRFAEIASGDPRTVERHKTLQATIEWSHNLLKEEEKSLFRRLSVFTGGFDLEAVEEVCANGSLPKDTILDLLSRLIDTCMIQATFLKPGQMRYGMLETLRQYADRLLVDKNESEETCSKHLQYFSRMAELAFEERMSSQARWVERIRLEHSNMLAALRWAERHALDKFQLLSANLSWFWGRSNDYSMAIEILERVMNSNPVHQETRARLHTGYGSLLATTGDFEKAQHLLEQGLSLWRDLENRKEEALVLASLSDLLFGAGDNEGGMKYASEAYDLAVTLNDPVTELFCLTFVGFGLVCLKKTKEARSMVRKAVKMAEDLENLYLICATHHMLGDCALIEGNYREAEKEYGYGLKTTLKSGDTAYTNIEMCGVAMSLAGQGRHAKALRVNAAATKNALAFGSWVPEEIPLVFWHELSVKLLAGTRKNLGEDKTLHYEEEGRAMEFQAAVAYTLDFGKD